MKKAIALTLAAIALLGLLVLLSRENILVAVVILVGFLLLGHREIWSLLRHHRMPVIDERVQSNLTSAMRATGIFFFIAIVVLLLLFRFNVFKNTPKELIISGQLVVVGVVYLLSYYYYDRVLPALAKQGRKWKKIFLISAGVSLAAIPLSILLHNLVDMVFHFEEAVFFILAVLVGPAALVLSLLGLLVIYLTGLFGSSGRGDTP
jgi:hypothetical protein